MQLFTPPSPFPKTQPSVFLAGSIAMGIAKPWQDEVADALKETEWIVLNPRRPDWDSSWRQDLSDPRFVEQVNWELDAQEAASHILMYFDPDTKSPISLLELGLFAASGKMRVCCPDGFWRKGNVDIVCLRHNIPMFEELPAMVNSLIEEL
ncbi:MAG: nucleoside 2-deoxyribosyltransferase domain-containing protein [Bacteroidia bacterium]|nr:nucleoside 2-deoxyribosyltransferase domain-containing protein [Bacteroidia bacterium]